MLSFMREQEPQDSSVQKPLTAAGGIPAVNADQTQEQEYLTVAAKGKNVRRSTYLLAVLFSASVLCLLFMIKRTTPQTATAAGSTAETEIELAISQLVGIKSEMFNRMDQIVKKFYEFSNVQQISVDGLAKNPFKHDLLWDNLGKISDIKEQNPDADADLIRQQRIRQQARKLQLLSIMKSKQGNCCMIDDRILYEGDAIEGFRVRQIGDDFVKLEWDQSQLEDEQTHPEHKKELWGMQIILKLSQ